MTLPASDTTITEPDLPAADTPVHRCCEHCDTANDVHAPHALGCPTEAMEIVDGEPVDEPTPGTQVDVDTPSEPASRAPAIIEHDLLDGVPEWTHQSEWKYDWIDFEGDRLAYRTPKPSAITGFSNSQGKYVSNRDKGDHVQLFLQLHLSRESWDRVTLRMMHPDSTYDLFTLARLVEAILNSGLEGLESALETANKADDAETAEKSG